MKSFLLAMQLLTRLPVNVRGEVSAKKLGRSVGFFPLAGGAIGLLLAVLAMGLARVFPAPIAAGLLVAALAAVSGGLHLDGLADFFDGLAVKSSGDEERDRGKRLAAMRDPAVGPIGATGIALAVLIKFLGMGVIVDTLSSRPAIMAAMIGMAPVVGRWAMVPAMASGRPARPDGLGRAFLDEAGPPELGIAVGWMVVLVAAVLHLAIPCSDRGGAAIVILGGAVAALVSARAFRSLAEKKFGGLTGDVLGAICETAEIVYLLGVTAWLREST